jgi:predicted amidohydrolase
MPKLSVAVAQISVTQDIRENQKVILRAIDFAISQNADILVTPEGSLSGYTHQFDTRLAQNALSEVTEAASGKLALALGTCFVETNGECYNQIRFYDKDGKYRGFHSKTLTCGSLKDPPRGEINNYAIQPLQTYELCGITSGGLICNDLWANPGCTPGPDPHLSQQLSRLGARIIYHSVNGGRDGSNYARNVVWPFHETNLLMRAKAGRVWIVTVDNCHPTDIPCSAPGGVINPEGQWVAKTIPVGEHLLVHRINLDA